MIVDWELDDTLETRMVLQAVDKAFLTAKPEILNSDQGCQFTNEQYTREIERNRVKISMDGVGRWADNIPIERWFRTLKYEEVYLKDYENIREARLKIGRFIHDYNFARIHSPIDTTPAYAFYPQQLYDMLAATPAATLDKALQKCVVHFADGVNLKNMEHFLPRRTVSLAFLFRRIQSKPPHGGGS